MKKLFILTLIASFSFSVFGVLPYKTCTADGENGNIKIVFDNCFRETIRDEKLGDHTVEVCKAIMIIEDMNSNSFPFDLFYDENTNPGKQYGSFTLSKGKKVDNKRILIATYNSVDGLFTYYKKKYEMVCTNLHL